MKIIIFLICLLVCFSTKAAVFFGEGITPGLVATNENVLQVGFTGNLMYPIMTSVSPAWGIVQATNVGNSTITTTEGVWVNTLIVQSEPLTYTSGLSSMSFSNLVGISVGNCVFAGLPVLTNLSFPLLQYINGTLTISSTPSLEVLSMPQLQFASGMNTMSTYTNMRSISFPELVVVGSGGAFGINTLNALTNLSIPKLTTVVNSFTPSTMSVLGTLTAPLLSFIGVNFAPSTLAALTNMSFPALATIAGTFTPGTMASLTNFSFPSLRHIEGTFAPTTMGALYSMNFPALTNVVGAFSITSMASLTNAVFTNMVSYRSTITMTTGLGALQNVSLGTPGVLKSVAGATINISGQALNAASVNAILALLVSLDGTGGTTLWGAGKTVNVSGGTSAAPSGQGIVDKATLQARTATVTTN